MKSDPWGLKPGSATYQLYEPGQAMLLLWPWFPKRQEAYGAADLPCQSVGEDLMSLKISSV